MSAKIDRCVWLCIALLLAWVTLLPGSIGCAGVGVDEVPGSEPSKEATADASAPDALADTTVDTGQVKDEGDVKEATPEPAPDCDFETPPGPIKVGQGGRFYLSTKTKPAGGSVAFPVLPGSWISVPQPDKQRLLVRTDYKDPKKHVIAVDLTCGQTTVRKRLNIEVTGITWSALPKWTQGKDGPSEREHPRIWIDPNKPDVLWLWGGLTFVPRQFTPAYDLWKLDIPTGKWQEVSATDTPKLVTGHVAVSPEGGKILMYGGDFNNKTSDKLYELAFDAATPAWKELTGDAHFPTSSTLGSWIYDPGHKRYVAACGFQQTLNYDIHCRVSTYEPAAEAGKRWQEWKIKGPTGRYGFAYAYDKEEQRLIVFSGGQQPVSRQDPINAATDTWALELKEKTPKWTQLKIEGTPAPPRRNGCWAMDPVGHRLFLFGGTADGRTSVPGLWALNLDVERPRWHRVLLKDAPPIRSSCSAIYDAKRKQILFGFGNIIGARYADFYALQLP